MHFRSGFVIVRFLHQFFFNRKPDLSNAPFESLDTNLLESEIMCPYVCVSRPVPLLSKKVTETENLAK